MIRNFFLAVLPYISNRLIISEFFSIKLIKRAVCIFTDNMNWLTKLAIFLLLIEGKEASFVSDFVLSYNLTRRHTRRY